MPIFVGSRGKTLVVAIGIVAALLVYGAWKRHHPASPLVDQSARVAAEANASTCTDTGYYVISRLDDSKQVIYDCAFASSADKCVIEQGGIASDATAEVKLLFATALGGAKPSCLAS